MQTYNKSKGFKIMVWALVWGGNWLDIIIIEPDENLKR
jgi:hypothetical protein